MNRYTKKQPTFQGSMDGKQTVINKSDCYNVQDNYTEKVNKGAGF